ncbi:hypothetical protein HPB52_007600 [Rhipicephalus sanguineus]|uniref:Uncharacterized protein n=1 Tax=Rhipicephalus sanguineus TaxID=34632 RepID=A0A9D4PCZ5_RHISA|nr:hypothetical protein HPB52_007600 [Rhipicephalus sanguineus]
MKDKLLALDPRAPSSEVQLSTLRRADLQLRNELTKLYMPSRTVVVSAQSEVINCTTVQASHPEEVKQVAITLAMLKDHREAAYSDSIRAFQKDCSITPLATTILPAARCLSYHSLHWFPADVLEVEGVPADSNEIVNVAA